VGLQRAGFEVEGWDIKPQPRYPFTFHHGDALEADLCGFDFVWASPPCQKFSNGTLSQRMSGKTYPDLIDATRKKLEASNIPFVIENVPGAPIRSDIVLCGSMFGLRLVRHRWFECSLPMFQLQPDCSHDENAVCVCGHNTPSWSRAKNGGKNHTIKEKHLAMGIDWMNRNELAQAIPPAYSEYIGGAAMRFTFENS